MRNEALPVVETDVSGLLFGPGDDLVSGIKIIQ